MRVESKEFLFKEYDAVWRELEHILNMRDKTIALYLALVGALASAGLGLVKPPLSCNQWVGKFLLDDLVCRGDSRYSLRGVSLSVRG